MTTISNFMSMPRAVAVSLAVVPVLSLMLVMVLCFDAHEGAGRDATGCIGLADTPSCYENHSLKPDEENVMTNQDNPADQTLCPVARAGAVVGDRWTMLILRELFMANHRFEEIQAQTGATPQMIAARLKKLEADGLVKRRIYSKRPLRHEYHLTRKGEAFSPVLLALRAWGETWCKSPKEGRAVRYTHRTCGKPAGLGPVCESCGKPLRREDLVAELNPAYRGEREARWEAFKAGR
jgi:DNA-binding HxlR family transcriptional regulator